MPELFLLLVPVVFSIALLYASVGLGGGSSYVAILYLFGMPLAEIPPIALFFNITASSVAFFKFKKERFVTPRLVVPLVAASVPAAFFGARLKLDDTVLSFIFAAVFFSIAFLLFFKKKEIQPKFSLERKALWALNFLLGAVLGLLAGIMGIGGGVFLGPVLLMLGIGSSKHIAGTCSAFVLVNSLVGLTSHLLQGRVEFSSLFILGAAVFGGAQLGAFLGTKKFSPVLLQRIFAVILWTVSLKLFTGAFG